MAEDVLDRRQRLAAAILLSAVDLPQPIDRVAGLWIEAAKVCPGVCVGEMPAGAGRVQMLKRAAQLIKEMLNEVGHG